MAAKITTAITAQRFELIRDRIATIIKEELTAQAILQPSIASLLNCNVFIERFGSINESELPCINLFYYQSANVEENAPFSQVMTHTYYIDLYVNAASTATDRGDKVASKDLQRLMGIIRAILQDARYNKLNFTTSFVENTAVTGMEMQDPLNNADSTNVMKGRLTYDVRCEEIAGYADPVAGEKYISKVKLADTDEGFAIANIEDISDETEI